MVIVDRTAQPARLGLSGSITGASPPPSPPRKNSKLKKLVYTINIAIKGLRSLNHSTWVVSYKIPSTMTTDAIKKTMKMTPAFTDLLV